MKVLEKSSIRSWKVHVSDDFFVVALRRRGLFLFRLEEFCDIDKMDEPGPCYRKEDVHEPRVFLIRGVATLMAELCNVPAEHFASTHPDIEYDLPIALVNLTIIPYGGGLRYMTNVSHHSQQHYSSPAAHAEGARVAVEAYQAAFSDAHGSPKLYTNFTDNDTDICRLTSDAENTFQKNIQHRNFLHAERFGRDTKSPTSTPFRCAMMLWNPMNDTNDPRFTEFLTDAAFGPRPLSRLREGFKRQVVQEILVNDDEPCPFHRYMGKADPFNTRCKQSCLENENEIYFYNPLKEEEGELVADTRTDPFKLFRLSVIDSCSVKVKVAPSHVPLIKERLDGSDLFLATNPYKWNYLGYFPAVLRDMGLAVFGDVSLDESGEFACEGMTSERVEALIHEMRHICDGIQVQDANVVSTPFQKKEPEKEALERNLELVDKSFGMEASFRIDKKAFSGKHCAYYDSTEEESLRRCPCRKIYYCSKGHQSLHW